MLFHPWRQYVVEGLRAGELRYWDPYVHEGVPLLYPPLGYPLDLLQALRAGPHWTSVLLALHVPLGAAACALLARRLGVAPAAAAGGAVMYALGGFMLSTLNLYVYVQAAAWAPLVVLSLRAAATGRARSIAAAAVVTALSLSTLGVEIALQAALIGFVLGVRPSRPVALRGAAAGALLGLALAAPVILVMRANMGAGERAHGFPVEVVLNQSVHPFTLVQVMAANLYGDLARLPDRWWGSNFFDRGFPYFLSLYVGATAVAVALTGAWTDRRRSCRLVLLALAALVVALGRWGGLEVVLRALPDSARVFRYPAKAFFTVHLCVALLVGIGLHALARGRGWRVLLVLLLAFGLPLALAPAVPWALPGPSRWFVGHFFPPALSGAARAANFANLLADAADGGLLALVAALVAVSVWAGRATPPLGAALVTALFSGDLLRAGAGLNPMMDPAGLAPAPEVLATVRGLPGLQRVYSCHPEASRAYWEARRLRWQQHEALTLSAWADMLMPHFNRPVHVASALGEDLTSLVPLSRLLPRGGGCGDVPSLLPRLRAAGVSHLLSLDPLEDPGLEAPAEVASRRLAPLHVFIYSVSRPVPLRFVASSVRAGPAPPGAFPSPERVWLDPLPEPVDGDAGSVRALREQPDHLELAVEASRPTALVVLDGASAGWEATVDGRGVPLLDVGHHRAVWIPAGSSIVRMSYRPVGLGAGLALMAASGAAVILLCVRGEPSRHALRERSGAPPASAA